MERVQLPASLSSSTAIDRVLVLADLHRGETFSDDFRLALNALADTPPEDFATNSRRLARELVRLGSSEGAGMIAVYLGASVEGGAKATPTAIPILRALLKWIRVLTKLPENRSTGFNPEGSILAGIQLLGRALVAHLLAEKPLRAAMSKKRRILSTLEKVAGTAIGAEWVAEALRQRSGGMLVIHAEKKIGVRIAYQNIANCFQYFTLLQTALEGIMPGALLSPPHIAAIAKGERNGAAQDIAWWHYGQPDSCKPELAGMISGDAPLDSISSIDGMQVMLLWKPIVSRNWDSRYFSPVLQNSLPSLQVTSRLSEEEVDAWLKRLRVSSKPDQSWWRFWQKADAR